MPYSFVISEKTLEKIKQYKNFVIQNGLEYVGYHFCQNLSSHLKKNKTLRLDQISLIDFILLLIQTKKPTIFAESAVFHNKNDWIIAEEEILGDITVTMNVRMFNDGNHTQGKHLDHSPPIQGVLAYVPGALLVSAHPNSPADKQEVKDSDGKINQDKLNALYERRLLPQLLCINEKAAAQNKKAAITIPGIGTGVFSGKYSTIKKSFKEALLYVLKQHADKLTHIGVIHYDSYQENTNSEEKIGSIEFRERTTKNCSTNICQLNYPEGTTKETHLLASFVAWDHFSYPGNDYLKGSRSTDDGVKGASTDTLAQITGVETRYEPESGKYLPPETYSTWEKYILEKGIKLEGPLFIATSAGKLINLEELTPTLDSKLASKKSANPILNLLLDKLYAYKIIRDNFAEYKHYFFSKGLGFSKTAKFNAIAALEKVLLNEENIPLNKHLPALRNKELGRTIRNFLKENDLVPGENITSISGLIAYLNRRANKPALD